MPDEAFDRSPESDEDRERASLAVLIAFLSRRWTMDILHILRSGERVRFGALRRALPGKISARVLSQTLRCMEGAQLVRRLEFGGAVRHVAYELTPSGSELAGSLVAAGRRAAGLGAARELSARMRETTCPILQDAADA